MFERTARSAVLLSEEKIPPFGWQSRGFELLRWQAAPMPRRLVTPVLLLVAGLASAAEDGKLLYEQNCKACHLPDQMIVGPSLIEITKLYARRPKDFLAWAKQPQRKRTGVIEMPSMAHLGDAALLAIRDHMAQASKGLKEQKPNPADPFLRPARRPEVRRIFLPDAGPAAIAVALPGDLAYAFDAGECRVRSVWRGGFLDDWAYYKGNGKARVVLAGKVIWRTGPEASPPPVKFLGYAVDAAGLPTFEYVRDGATFRETVTADGNRLVRRFAVETTGPVELRLDPATTASAGLRVGDVLRLTPAEAKAFTLTVRLP